MSGSWEIRRQSSVLVAVLHTDLTTIAWALGLRNLIIPGPVSVYSGMPYDHARNKACQDTLDCGAEWCMMLDSDVIPPRDAIPRLMSRGLPLVSGIYCRRSPPVGVPVMQRGGWVTSFPANSIIEVDVVGAGCLLIHRDLLKSLPPVSPERGKHWFDWRVDMGHILPPGRGLSEDFSFCLHCRENGYKVSVDTSVICKHVGLAQAGYGKFEALDLAPVG